MSYHEHDLGNVNVSYGVSLKSWALPLEITIGASGLRSHGFGFSVLCFWFGMHWWEKDYPTTRADRDADSDIAWNARFTRHDDIAYQIEALDIEAGEIVALARRVRNAADVLRDLHAVKEAGNV